MLTLILGRAGSGKTTRLLAEIEKVTAAGGKAILLVPEQFSFESEKGLFMRLGAAKSSLVEVLSFTRLCDNIFRYYGGLAGAQLTDTARHILMSIALDEAADNLTVYHGKHAKAALISEMVMTVRELKTAGVTPEALLEAEPDSSNLREKIQDIGIIYRAYQSLIDAGFTDSDDDIRRALARLEPQEFFADTTVFIDSFTAFMAGENSMLSAVIAGAKDVFAAFTCDGLAENEGGLGVFSSARQSASALVRMAHDSAVTVASPVVLQESFRFKGSDISAVEHGFLQEHDFTDKTDGSVELFSARDVYDECEYIAADIAKNIRENGSRYRSIAVICRSLEPYLIALPRVFKKYGIPFFMDTAVSASNTPVVAVVQAALACILTGFSTEAVLRFAKCTAVGIPRADVAALENYSYTWGVERGDWINEFTNNPDGLAESFTDEQKLRLSAINETRIRIVNVLQKLKSALTEGTGYGFATALSELLTQISAGDNIAVSAELLPKEERNTYLDEQGAIWDSIMALLTAMAQVIGDRKAETSRLAELFTIGAGTIEVGQIPQTLDQVIVGMADRIRPSGIETAYIVGAQSDEFPAACRTVGVFGDGERQELIDIGLELSQTAVTQAVREKFYAYFALTVPSDRLCVSYCRSAMSGGENTPSVIVSEISEILGIQPKPTAELPWDKHIVNMLTAEEELATEQSGSEKYATLAALVGEERTEKLAERQAAARGYEFEIKNTDTAKALFGEQMKLSPSQIEKFYSCAFLYFCAYGLHVRPRTRAEFNPMESGVVTHMVLQVLLERYSSKELCDIKETALRRDIKEIIDSYLADRIKDSTTMPKRFYYMYTRLIGSLVQLVQRLAAEFAQSLFEPAAFELKIGDEITPPLELTAQDGTKIFVHGTVDRADIMEDSKGKYLRIVDYKTGAKTFELSDVVQGLNMQMLIYLFALEKNGSGKLANSIPAGVLYMPSASVLTTSLRRLSPDEAAKERQKAYKMSGLVLADSDVLEGMEREIAGVFIPAKRKKDGGFDSYSSVASLSQLGKLEHSINKSITGMAELLNRGKIAAMPVRYKNGSQPCDYCDYKIICGHEDSHPVHDVRSMKNGEVWAELERSEADAEQNKVD